MSFKVVIPQPIVDCGVQYLKDNGCEVVIGNGSQDKEYIKSMIADADAILARTASYPAEVLACAPKLKVIGRFGVGVDNIDLDYCKAHGIMVTVAPGANSNSVAEHTIMFILMLARHAVVQDENTRNGNYNARNTIAGHDVIGKTLAILGLGRIGRLVAEKAHFGLGMKIVAFDPYVPQEKAPEYVKMIGDFYECAALGDFVTIHTPALPEYDGVANMKLFKAMKPTAYFINNARGALQNEQELAKALKEHVIAGAALDVSRQEPNNIEDELWQIRENLILSPHNAGLTVETKDAMAMLAAQGIVSVKNGERPQYPFQGF